MRKTSVHLSNLWRSWLGVLIYIDIKGLKMYYRSIQKISLTQKSANKWKSVLYFLKRFYF